METNTYKKFKDSPKDNYPQWLVIHHSAATENQTVESIENYHLSLGWEGIGYAYVITKLGEVWKGRPEHYHGAHVKEQNINFKSIGILMVGDFDKKLPTEEQVSALKALLLELQARYSIPNEKIVPHRRFLGKPPYKSCYGKLLSDDWLKQLLQSSAPVTGKSIILKRLAELTQLVEQL